MLSYNGISNWKFLFSILIIDRRGEFRRQKKECLKLHVINVAKAPQCHSSLEKASQFTVAHASRNAFRRDETVPHWTSVLIRKTRGQGETKVSKEEKSKTQPAFSINTSNRVREVITLQHDCKTKCLAGSVISIYQLFYYVSLRGLNGKTDFWCCGDWSSRYRYYSFA